MIFHDWTVSERVATSLFVSVLCLISDMMSNSSKYAVDNSKNQTLNLQCFYFEYNIKFDTFRAKLQMALMELLANLRCAWN